MNSSENAPRASRSNPGILAAVYALYFATGATALIFEILWTRRFVTVFGNSTYAASVVLAAFMGGLGLGALLFGKIADRRRDTLGLFALLEAGIIVSALLVPVFLNLLAGVMPGIAASMPSLAAETVVRFAFSFVILLVPCLLMGGTLPVLTRFVVTSREKVAARLSLLYGLNTLGAAFGCFLAGFFLIETFGQSRTGTVALVANACIILVVLVLRVLVAPAEDTDVAAPAEDMPAIAAADEAAPSLGRILLLAAFVSGFATMAVEVLWIRFLVFVVPNSQYSFTSILGVLLFGLAVGSLLYNVLLAGRAGQIRCLAVMEIVLGPVILVMLVAGAYSAMGSGPQGFATGALSSGGFLTVKAGAVLLAVITILLPAVIIGAVFPLVASSFTRSVSAVGRSVGAVYAVNTLGSILGALAPVVFIVALLGIQNGIFAVAVLNSALGVVILIAASPRRARVVPFAVLAAAALVAAFYIMPADLTRKVFFANPDHKGRHQDVLFYREGPTATVMVLKDSIAGFKEVYIGGIEEVPTVYTGQFFFKVFGSLPALVHPEPDNVLVLCLGGGVAAGAVIENPDVKSVECVDLVEDMVNAARELSDINNSLVDSPKFSVAIEDARNYLAKTDRKFPVIMCDSTHPKSPDSWPLYTTEFYQSVKSALASDGVFLQWAPVHGLSIDEYRIIVRTFQSVFPHTSIWYVAAVDEIGNKWTTTMMLATPERLSIDLDLLQRRLAAPSVQADLAYWGLDTPEGILSTFLCGEETVAQWTAGLPVNTDDLPYTQYFSRFTGATEYGWPEIAPRMESVVPYLDLDSVPDPAPLVAALEKSVSARKIFLTSDISRALAASPDDPILLTMKDNLSRSETYLQNLAELYRDDAAMLVRIARKMQGVLQRSGKNPREAYEGVAGLYHQAIELNPADADAYVDLGALYALVGRADYAAECFDRALALDPSNVQARFAYGTFLYDTDKLPEAVDQLERAVRLAPDRFDAHNSLAIAYIAEGNVDDAIPHLEKAVALSAGTLPDLQANLGSAYAMKGDFRRAVDCLRLAVAAEPDATTYRLYLGSALLETGDTDAARKEFQAVLALDDANSAARTKLGIILFGEGRTDEAVDMLNASLALSPYDAKAREYLARALLLKRDFAKARSILHEGMMVSPSPEIAASLAWLLATCPDPSQRSGIDAVAIAEKLDELTGLSSPEIADTLAAAYAEAGFFESAVKTAQQAVNRATLQGRSDLLDGINKRLALYQAGKPYHEP